jgi:sugar lactone lactonase YvrE
MLIQHALTLFLFATGVVAGCASQRPSSDMVDGSNDGDHAGTGNDAGVGSDAGDAGDPGDAPSPLRVSTLAGMATAGYVDGPREVAAFSNPVNVAYRDGKLYVADFDNSKLRVIDVETQDTSTVIAQPGFQRPFGMAFASDGTLYVSTDNDQMGDHSPMSGTIWKVDVAAQTATIVAGAIGRPRGLAMLPDGRLAVADYLHHVIEVVDPSTGGVQTIAGAWDAKGMVDGPGPTARFSTPYSVALRGDGTLLVTDFDNHRIRVVALDGTTTTLSGTDDGFLDGAPGDAKWSHPQGMSVAANGDIYLTDLGNFRVRRIAGNRVETIAGNGQGGYLDSNDQLAAEFYGLEGLVVVPDGSMVYVADGSRGEDAPYNRVRQVKLN